MSKKLQVQFNMLGCIVKSSKGEDFTFCTSKYNNLNIVQNV
jgi:hypothetical protein